MTRPTTAMILAAGRGERMRPLTDHTPKPLLEVNGEPLICFHLRKFASLGFTKIVINHAWLGEQIEQRLGNGHQYGLNIHYSPEDPVLETAGGIVNALPLLGDEPFVVVNGDVWCDFDFGDLTDLPENTLAKLVMVPNPEYHSEGDFQLQQGQLYLRDDPSNASTYTFSGIALYRPQFFYELAVKKQALAPILKKYIAKGQILGELHNGVWCDVGTPERLARLNQE